MSKERIEAFWKRWDSLTPSQQQKAMDHLTDPPMLAPTWIRPPRMRRKVRVADVSFTLFCALVGYVVISGLAFRFRHPEMTETELFLRFFDAMLWR